MDEELPWKRHVARWCHLRIGADVASGAEQVVNLSSFFGCKIMRDQTSYLPAIVHGFLIQPLTILSILVAGSIVLLKFLCETVLAPFLAAQTYDAFAYWGCFTAGVLGAITYAVERTMTSGSVTLVPLISVLDQWGTATGRCSDATNASGGVSHLRLGLMARLKRASRRRC